MAIRIPGLNVPKKLPEVPTMKVAGKAQLPTKMSTMADHLDALRQYPDEVWDALYKEALESGDMEYAKKIVDLHARAKAPEGATIETGYIVKRHDSPDIQPDPMGSLTATPPSKVPETYIGVATDRRIAKDWETASRETYPFTTGYYGDVRPVQVMVNNPNEVFSHSAAMKLLPTGVPTPYVHVDAGAYKHYYRPGYGNVITDYYIKNPAHIKSADVITRDVQGNIIPLSQRHNWSINDLRYSIVPFLIGAGAAYGDKE